LCCCGGSADGGGCLQVVVWWAACGGCGAARNARPGRCPAGTRRSPVVTDAAAVHSRPQSPLQLLLWLIRTISTCC
jgi:hypothetical protein